jgi:hypothetical protein
MPPGLLSDLSRLIREPPFLLGFGIIFGLCVAGLITALIAWHRKEEEEKGETDRNEENLTSDQGDPDVDEDGTDPSLE